MGGREGGRTNLEVIRDFDLIYRKFDDASAPGIILGYQLFVEWRGGEIFRIIVKILLNCIKKKNH